MVYAVVWAIALERTKRTFEDKAQEEDNFGRVTCFSASGKKMDNLGQTKSSRADLKQTEAACSLYFPSFLIFSLRPISGRPEQAEAASLLVLFSLSSSPSDQCLSKQAEATFTFVMVSLFF